MCGSRQLLNGVYNLVPVHHHLRQTSGHPSSSRLLRSRCGQTVLLTYPLQPSQKPRGAATAARRVVDIGRRWLKLLGWRREPTAIIVVPGATPPLPCLDAPRKHLLFVSGGSISPSSTGRRRQLLIVFPSRTAADCADRLHQRATTLPYPRWPPSK